MSHPSVPDYQWIQLPPIDIEPFTLYSEASDGLLVTDDGWHNELVNLKAELDPVSNFRKTRARAETNPLEAIGSHFFINRAALKMAELDSIFCLIEEAARLTLGRCDGELRVVDLCGGPGGFVEYIQWRSHRTVTSSKPDKRRPALEKISNLSVTGITLKGENDYRPNDFCIDAPVDTFTVVKGEAGGDLLSRGVTSSIVETLGGPHLAQLCIGDGGFDFSGREEEQEKLIMPLLAAQLSAGLSCLCEGGALVQKLYSVHLPFTARLIHLVGTCFEEFTLIKPLTSRPSNSEQYLVAKRRRAKIAPSLGLLHEVTQSLCNGTQPRLMLSQLPPAFLMWLRKTSHSQAVSQMQSLSRMVMYATVKENGKGGKGGKGDKGGKGGKGGKGDKGGGALCAILALFDGTLYVDLYFFPLSISTHSLQNCVSK